MSTSLRHQTMIDLVVMLADLYDADKAQFSVRGAISPRRPWGFHLAKSDIYGPEGMGDKDYSVEHARNKAAVSEYSAGFDINVGMGKEKALVKYLVENRRRLTDPATGRTLLFEIIGPHWDTGKATIWSRRHNWVPREARADHEWHIHLSFWRDMEAVDKRPAFFEHFGISEYPEMPDTPPPPDPEPEPAPPPEPTKEELLAQIAALEAEADTLADRIEAAKAALA